MEFPRPLMALERATLDFLLSTDVPAAEALRTGPIGEGDLLLRLRLPEHRSRS